MNREQLIDFMAKAVRSQELAAVAAQLATPYTLEVLDYWQPYAWSGWRSSTGEPMRQPQTRRCELAREFVFCFLALIENYGRRSYNDYRVQAARRRYLASVASDCWRRAA